MTALEIGLAIWAIVFAAAMAGLALNRKLPSSHVDESTKDVVKVSMAVLGTMTALVIGFLISNANASFSARKTAMVQASTNVIRLDDLLRRYGPQADPARLALQNYLATQIKNISPGRLGNLNLNDLSTAQILDGMEDQVLAFKPANDRQTWIAAQALQLLTSMNNDSSLFVDQTLGTIPLPFLANMIVWLAVLFGSFGLFAPRNATVVVVFLLCTFSIAAGLKMVMDLNTPFGGPVHMSGFPLRLSDDSMQQALSTIRQPAIMPNP